MKITPHAGIVKEPVRKFVLKNPKWRIKMDFVLFVNADGVSMKIKTIFL